MAVTISVEVDESVSERLTLLAAHSRFTSEELHRMALDRFLDDEIEHLQHVLLSRQDIDAGRLIPHSAIKTWIDSLGTESELAAPRSEVFQVQKAS